MSFDHKPEDDPERERVVKAGGKVTADGRVNGGLNLSRAIGDHAYKQNKELSDREQMITALPDVRTLTIDPAEDEFMVLACDGIWNSLSSQQVVDFVIPRVKPHQDRLSRICEEVSKHCLFYAYEVLVIIFDIVVHLSHFEDSRLQTCVYLTTLFVSFNCGKLKNSVLDFAIFRQISQYGVYKLCGFFKVPGNRSFFKQ